MNHKRSMDDGGVVNDLKKAIRCQENDEAKKLIESILDSRILEESEGSKDISILMFAAIYSIRPTDIIIKLIKKCPQLVTKQRKDGYRGQTVLHILINRGQLEAVETVLNMAGSECSDYLLHVQSKGKHFEGTAMMGELPLSVAALTFNKEMVDLLLIWGADISEQNSKGDTVLHSLIRYSNFYPEKHTKVESMMDYLNENLVRGPCAGVEKHVWRIENKEELTALQLAANLSTSGSSLFSYIFNLKGVYCHFDDSDGMFNSFEFDITEIDTMADWERRNQNLEQASSVTSDGESKFQRKTSIKAADLIPERFEKGFSVLEMVCELKAEDAFPVLKNEIVVEVVKQKWDYYLLWFISFLLLHLGLMILVTIYAVYKAEIICYQILAEHRNNSKACQEFASVTMARREEEQTFVLATSIVLVLPEMALMAYESLRLYHKPPKLDLLFERNAIYRVLLVFLAVCLMMDNVWFWVAGVSNNFFLILALLVGWWFMIFFLRPFKLFSFFTVMMQKVLVGDMARFFCFIIFEFIAFSAAMYILYVPAPNGPPEEFKTVQATIMTMFQLMLGLADLQVLSDSSIPWLTTLLFVFFVLLTYALMLNALIALMSCTCSGVAAKTEQHCKLQRLSVILYMETLFPTRKMVFAPGRPLPSIELDRTFLEGRHIVLSDLSEESRGQTLADEFALLRSRAQQDILSTENGSNEDSKDEVWTDAIKAFDEEITHVNIALPQALSRLSTMNIHRETYSVPAELKVTQSEFQRDKATHELELNSVKGEKVILSGEFESEDAAFLLEEYQAQGDKNNCMECSKPRIGSAGNRLPSGINSCTGGGIRDGNTADDRNTSCSADCREKEDGTRDENKAQEDKNNCRKCSQQRIGSGGSRLQSRNSSTRVGTRDWNKAGDWNTSCTVCREKQDESWDENDRYGAVPCNGGMKSFYSETILKQELEQQCSAIHEPQSSIHEAPHGCDLKMSSRGTQHSCDLKAETQRKRILNSLVAQTLSKTSCARKVEECNPRMEMRGTNIRREGTRNESREKGGASSVSDERHTTPQETSANEISSVNSLEKNATSHNSKTKDKMSVLRSKLRMRSPRVGSAEVDTLGGGKTEEESRKYQQKACRSYTEGEL